MTNWYYVQGSERVGPVGEDVLRDLFTKGDINSDTYIWKKGFQNWERLKDVSELDLSKPVPKIAVAPKSPEIVFTFEWNSIREEEEIFYLKVGKDRKDNNQKVYGPYSRNELKDAIAEKRINDHTLIFAAGMKGWTTVGETPLNKTKLRFNADYSVEEAPLLLVVDHEPLPLIALVEEAGGKECTLLGAGAFQPEDNVLCSLYKGSALKAKNLKVNIVDYNAKDQKVHCKILDMDENAKSLFRQYAH